MKIESSKAYRMIKYTKDSDSDFGILPGVDVKRILRGYTYDEETGMWFSSKCKIGYEVTEAE